MASIREHVDEFVKIPEINVWLKGAELKPKTKLNYSHRLMRLLEEMQTTPKQLLTDADKDRKTLLGKIKSTLAASKEHSASIAHQQRAALISFINYYNDQFDQPLTVNSKVKVVRVWQKREFTFDTAGKVIAECNHPYREIFRFLLWSGMDQSTFTYINGNEECLKQIREQLGDKDRDYVRIDLPPRKSNTDVYFVVIPKFAFEGLTLPVSTRENVLKSGKTIGGKLIEPNKLKKRWRLAAIKAGVYHVGMGPHQLRSAFQTRAAYAQVEDRMLQFHMGRGADKYGYVRPSELNVVNEIRKAWTYEQPATKQELSTRDAKITELERKVHSLEEAQKMLDVLDRIITPELIQKWKAEGKKVVISSEEYERRRKAGESNMDIFGLKSSKKHAGKAASE